MIALLSWIVATLLAIPLAVYAIEVLIGLPRGGSTPSPAPCRTAVLVPAHNEEAGIAATVAALLAMAPQCRILVVADNCSDRTALLAREAGAEAVERFDAERRGKGYALDFGRTHLAGGALEVVPEVVIVLDADCRLAPGSVEALAGQAFSSQQPAQAIYLLEPDRAASARVQISNFAMLIKNLVRARGLSRLGGVALLGGTGMAFPWALFREAALATDHLVEDLALSVELILGGHRPQRCEAAAVSSPAAHVDDLIGQRSRWERGFVQVARRWALPLLGNGLRNQSRASLAVGLDLLVPPLALLLALAGAGLAVLSLSWLTGSPAAPALVLGAFLTLALLATFAAWLREGRTTLTARALLSAPFYVLWKVPMYLRSAVTKAPGWVRTPRR